LSVASDLFSRPTIHRVLKGRALVILALPMGFVLLLSSLQLNVPRYFIEHKLGTDQLGAFTALAYLVVVGSTLITAVSQTISPQFATSLADGDRLRATQLLWRLLGISALIGSASVVAAAVGGYTVLALLYTPAIARNTDAFVLIMLAGAVAYVLGALGSALTAMRILRPQLWIQMASVGSSVVVSPFLIGRYGLAGAGAVMLITNVVAVVPFAVLVARHLRTIRPVRQSAEGLDLPSPTGIVGGGSSSIAKQRRPHVVVLLRKLDVGGAERQILTFAKACAGSDTRLTLVSFYDGGELVETDQQRQGIHLVTLGKRRRWDLLRFTAAAIRTIRALRPDVIYGYQAVANELSLVIGRLLGAKVVWGLRASNMDLATYGWMTRATFRLGAFLSRFADLIVVNSYCGAQYFGSAGYAAKRMIVIPNGIDTDMFRPDVAAGAALRRAWNILPRTRLVGVVARLDPMKDHDTFLEAAAFVVQRHPDVRFVCVGDGPTAYRQSLRQRCTDLGLDRFVIWAGTERRIAAVMSAIDVLCSSSAFGEGFSNVIGEAMACETPCVVTDVGDAARIVGATGVVVPPGSPQAMSDALLSVLTLEPETLRAMGMRARRRVEEHFSVGKLVVDTCSALDSVA
jgi:glycosyltransferase involved in cell wall biosynthesis